MTAEPHHITNLSAQLYVELQQLTAAIGLYRSYYTMAGFIPKTQYHGSHVGRKQDCYSAEQWLSDFFANKTGLIPSFLDMSQCVPPSRDAAAKMLGSFLQGLDEMPTLTPKDGGEPLSLFEALRADIHAAHKSRKLRGTSPIILTDQQKTIGLALVDDVQTAYQRAANTMHALHERYQTEK